jgi:hypothetical protein
MSPNPIYDGTPYTGTTAAGAMDGYNWGLAFWDATDDVATKIRTDANFANRSGDTQRMSIAIYTIGYLGSGGLDDGLLKKIANDKSSPAYQSTQPTGSYVAATDSAALSQAFASVASQILRLTR